MKTEYELSKPLTILSSIIPPIGFILYFIYREKFPKKAVKALVSALIGIPIGYAMGQHVIPFLTSLVF